MLDSVFILTIVDEYYCGPGSASPPSTRIHSVHASRESAERHGKEACNAAWLSYRISELPAFGFVEFNGDHPGWVDR